MQNTTPPTRDAHTDYVQHQNEFKSEVDEKPAKLPPLKLQVDESEWHKPCNFCELYIDDVIIYADSEEELGQRLSKFHDRFKKFNIKAHPNNIKFGLTEIEYIGRMLPREGTHITDNNIKTVMEFKTPVNQGQLKSFLGMTGYLQQYIPKYLSYERPSMELATPYKKRIIIKWTEHTSQVFEDLKKAFQQAQTLFFFDDMLPDSEVILRTDGSDKGAGGIIV